MSSVKIADIQSKREIIKKAICHYAALIDCRILPEPIFKVLSKFINPNFIDDKSLLKNERIKDIIEWDKLEKMKLIRLIVRDKYIIERLDLNKHDFTLRDLIPIFIVHPDLIEHFELDYENLSAIDAIKMLEININFLSKIDLGKYSYSKHEMGKIIDSFHKTPEIIEKLNLETLDHYSVRVLIKKSGEKYIHKLDLKKLKALDWFEILTTKPELLKHCDLSIFQTGDCFLLIKIVQLFPHLDYLIEENKYKISALGWETLLIHNPDKYSKCCDFESLSKKNWDSITTFHPGMTNLMNRYIL